MDIKKMLMEIRYEKKLSQAELSEILNIDQSHISRWETGKAKPNKMNQYKLEKLYNETVEIQNACNKFIKNLDEHVKKYFKENNDFPLSFGENTERFHFEANIIKTAILKPEYVHYEILLPLKRDEEDKDLIYVDPSNKIKTIKYKISDFEK